MGYFFKCKKKKWLDEEDEPAGHVLVVDVVWNLWVLKWKLVQTEMQLKRRHCCCPVVVVTVCWGSWRWCYSCCCCCCRCWWPDKLRECKWVFVKSACVSEWRSYEVFALSYLKMPLDHVTHTGAMWQDAAASSFYVSHFLAPLPSDFPSLPLDFPTPLAYVYVCGAIFCVILFAVACGLENAPDQTFQHDCRHSLVSSSD